MIHVSISGTFNMHVSVESLFFIGSQLVALSRPPVGKIGVWHSMTQHWQIQDVTPVSSFDTAGSLLLLGCSNGSICYIGKTAPLSSEQSSLSKVITIMKSAIFSNLILFKPIYFTDMQKFPLRMKDNDLLVTELYRNPTPEAITSISVYLTPKTSNILTTCFVERAITRCNDLQITRACAAIGLKLPTGLVQEP
jgi:hypothetical protein